MKRVGNPTKIEKFQFSKGKSGNPKGRPAIPAPIINIAKLAIADISKYYNLLWAKVDKGDIDAMRLYQNLIPKKWKEVYDTMLIPQDTTSVDAQIESLRKGIAQFEEHTLESATNVLRVLSTTKMADTQMQTEADVIEDRKALIDKIDQVLEMADKEGKA